MSGGLGVMGGGRAAQVGPVDVGAKVFAADGAGRRALNGWAAIGRDTAHAAGPLRDQNRAQAKLRSKLRPGLSAGREVRIQVHTRSLALRKTKGNSVARILEKPARHILNVVSQLRKRQVNSTN